MQHLGEIISLIVALSWTATAIFADIASHRLGALSLNLIRMGLSIVFLGVLLLAAARICKSQHGYVVELLRSGDEYLDGLLNPNKQSKPSSDADIIPLP